MEPITIFEIVEKHMLKQKKQSVNSGGMKCAYRGVDGLKCAVGCLIKDEFYRPDIEHGLSTTPAAQEAVAKSLGYEKEQLPKNILNLLCDLQDIHDQEEPECWKRELKKIRKRILDGVYEKY